ncbi:AraC family transcriptional regulator [Paenibacillus filicis]|uniref:AraC family transcriptional regulator n=1 Tax=Paenibacillus filicis TaxID=669464 RepID=A0ABU9DTS2_9BACL
MAYRNHPWHELITSRTGSPLTVILSPVELGTSLHWHKELELVYILEGRMQIELESAIFELSEGDLLVIGSCDVHRYFASPQGCHKLIVQLDESMFDSCGEAYFSRRFASPLVRPGHRLHAGLELEMRKMHREITEALPGHQAALKASAYTIITELIRGMELVERLHDERSRRYEKLSRLEQAISYIERNYDQGITVSQAAEYNGYSVHHFSRFFKEATGHSFGDYVNHYRIRVACQLLQDVEQPITDIAYRSGFNSIETFNRVFKKTTGSTPSAYRSKL